MASPYQPPSGPPAAVLPPPTAASPARPPMRGLRSAVAIIVTLVVVVLIASTIPSTLSKARLTAYPRPILGSIIVNNTGANLQLHQQVQFSVQVRAGNELSYFWDFGDGGTSTSASPIYAFNQFGTQEVSVRVTDPLGQSASTDTQVAVLPPPPHAFFNVDTSNCSSFYTGCYVYFDGSQSSGDNLSYFWDFGDGSGLFQASAQPAHYFYTGQSYVVTLRVEDDYQQQDTTTQSFSI
jgi:PKD repeat protein